MEKSELNLQHASTLNNLLCQKSQSPSNYSFNLCTFIHLSFVFQKDQIKHRHNIKIGKKNSTKQVLNTRTKEKLEKQLNKFSSFLLFELNIQLSIDQGQSTSNDREQDYQSGIITFLKYNCECMELIHYHVKVLLVI